MSVNRKTHQLGRWTIVLVALISLVPFSMAWYYARHPELITKTSNYGELIAPSKRIDPSDFKVTLPSGSQERAEIKGRWVLLQVTSGSCLDLCLANLHKTHQVWLMLNKEMPRVKRLLVSTQAKSLPEPPKQGGWDDSILLSIAEKEILKNLGEVLGGGSGEGQIILIDPEGNLVLKYAADFDPYRMVKDLKHLLNASQIG